MLGKMRHRLEIQAPIAERNNLGEEVITWQTVDKRWAAMEPVSGGETWRAQQVQSDVTHKISLRYYGGLTPKHRFRKGERIFEIVSVINPDEVREFHLCQCVERV